MRRWLNTAGEIAVVLLVVAVAKSAIAEPYYVPSGSMEPTLLVGDELLATKGIVASWDVKTKEQPVWTWPAGLRGTRFFTAVH